MRFSLLTTALITTGTMFCSERKSTTITSSIGLSDLPKDILDEVVQYSLNPTAKTPSDVFTALDTLRLTSKQTKATVDNHIKQFLEKNKISFTDQNAYNEYKKYMWAKIKLAQFEKELEEALSHLNPEQKKMIDDEVTKYFEKKSPEELEKFIMGGEDI